MKIEVNIEKKYAFLIIGLIIVLIGVIGVYASWDNSKTVFHSANDVKVTISGQDYSLQEVMNNGLIGGSESGTLCGLSIMGDFQGLDNAVACKGIYPSAGCPAGYTRVVAGRVVWDLDYLQGKTSSVITGAHIAHCVKN